MAEEKQARLIALTGSIGSGKSTVAEYLSRRYGLIEYMFAEPLKSIAITLGFKPKQIYGSQADKLEINDFWGISGREFMQKFGTEVCRDELPRILPDMKLNNCSVWVRLFEKFYAEHEEHIVVSDLRFADEYESVKRLDGYVIKIANDKSLDSTHKSELEVIPADFVISNTKSLEYLYAEVDVIMASLNILPL